MQIVFGLLFLLCREAETERCSTAEETPEGIGHLHKVALHWHILVFLNFVEIAPWRQLMVIQWMLLLFLLFHCRTVQTTRLVNFGGRRQPLALIMLTVHTGDGRLGAHLIT